MDPEGNPVFYRYWLKGPATGGFWRIARDWSTDPTWVWPTSPADAGTSEIQVQVRDGLHSSPAGWDDDAGALFTVLRPNLPPTLISLKPDKPSSQVAGTPIKWMAVASDPDREPVFYKFWLKGPSTGNAWKVVQDWSTKNQWTWADAPAAMVGLIPSMSTPGTESIILQPVTIAHWEHRMCSLPISRPS